MKAKRKKKATRNERAVSKISKTLREQRDEYENKNSFAVDYDNVETPEGYTSFADFVNKEKTDKEYKKADPNWRYTKTKTLPLGLAYQSWRGKNTSIDGKNYKAPYWAKSDPDDAPRIFNVIEKGSGGKSVNSPYTGRKKGHELEKLDNTLLDKAKQTIGAVFPPANILLGGGATTGGTAMDEAAIIGSQALLRGKVVPMERRQLEIEEEQMDRRRSGLPLDTDLQAEWRELNKEKTPYGFAHFYNKIPVQRQTWLGRSRNLTQEGLVVPTGGIMRNPYNKAVKNILKQGKKKNRDVQESLLGGEKAYTREQGKESLVFSRIADRYEKEFGFRPSQPEASKYTRPEHKVLNNKKTQNRNPLYLKNGGKILKAKNR
tara:strand:- start:854 stop:1978 length:1125 start_codon:yes stop_codon:yes gene_type:complete